MVFVPGGAFSMGSENFYPEEAPIRRVAVDSFWLDETPVTNRQFADFVDATGHVTVAEIAPDPKSYPGLLDGMDRAGSLVFREPAMLARAVEPQDWWHFEFGACWRQPLGADGDLDALDLWDHPVVHVAYKDALAYAKWAGKDLPTEAEFEYAARAGLDGKDYAWGDELAPDGQMMANYWQGMFPFANQCLDGWERTSPVKTFPSNAYGLFDMIGNTWEWTRDWWSDGAELRKKRASRSCCTLSNPRGGTLNNSFDPAHPDLRIGRKVIKGGSHLCAANYCQRYRPAARHPEMMDTATTHIGFRCIFRESNR
ncbi:formylglycine-generating enzyme family protein [Rhizorhabdus argentea]|uniref:formylglycine-generating enzyme family protein n=1 Tax=Rhizorhabdus argentea TaxID=1387174 RepID=UPI0030EB8F49